MPITGQRPPSEEGAATHILFVDDSGTKEYSPSGVYGSGNTRHFVFGGPFLAVDQAKRLAAKLRRLKVETFGTDRVEVKSNWLRLENERTARYLRKFGLTDADLTRFVEAFYQAVVDSELVLIACVRSRKNPPEDACPLEDLEAVPVRPCVDSRAILWIGAKSATLYTADS